MAWNVKPSGTMTIERRSEPYLTDSMKSELRERYLPRFETSMGALIPALHMIQHAYCWIPAQALEEIAEFLEISVGEALDTASFYEEFHLKPRGEHIVAVCRSIACEFCDHKAVTDKCKEKLGIELGETTPDGKFTLVELECLGSCGSAPVVLIDEDLHERLTPEAMGRALDAAVRGERAKVDETTSDLSADVGGGGDGHGG